MAGINLSKCLGGGFSGTIYLAGINFRGGGGSVSRLPDFNEDFNDDFLIEDETEEQ